MTVLILRTTTKELVGERCAPRDHLLPQGRLAHCRHCREHERLHVSALCRVHLHLHQARRPNARRKDRLSIFRLPIYLFALLGYRLDHFVILKLIRQSKQRRHSDRSEYDELARDERGEFLRRRQKLANFRPRHSHRRQIDRLKSN